MKGRISLMKWKKGLTAEEAALVATGLEGCETIDFAKVMVPPHDPFDSKTDSLLECEQIYNALLEEIWIAEEGPNATIRDSLLDIYITGFSYEGQEFADPAKSIVTKKSLAEWFWASENEDGKKIALKFNPTIENKENSSSDTPLQNSRNPDSPIDITSVDDPASTLSLESSSYWRDFESRTIRAISDFPSWEKEQRVVQKSGNLHHWLNEKIAKDTRQTEIIKRVLADVYKF